MSPPGKRGQFFCETVKVLTGLKRFQSDLDFQFSKDPWTLVFQRDFGFGHFIPDFSRDWFFTDNWIFGSHKVRSGFSDRWTGFSIWILDFCSLSFCYTKIVYQLSFFNILKQKFAAFRSKLIEA